ncbi:putative alcohol dehydrogenase [Polyplosphaeria fusca]|uniref:Alcohol dehydrogenase n=1 Tax=Polyplosphaeria fusca TaxID=682080 RepID=A0A9P4V3B7_9PLEO|nr:putative alcohol dehydrogenase [Polyplosphaeria fusca]
MASQTALVVTKIGEPVTSVSNWPVPQPGHKQIQIRIKVVGLNPHDQKGRDRGLFIADNLPAVLGNDGVGVVTALGEDASRFNIGDVVFAQVTGGGLKQFAIVDEDHAAVVPKGISEDACATLPINLVTGIVTFFDDSGFGLTAPWTTGADPSAYAQSQILIIGAGTNCGKFAVQLAKLAGFGKIVALGGKEDELTKYGATHVLDRHGGYDIVRKRIQEAVGDDLMYSLDAFNAPDEQYIGINALSNSKKGKFARLISRMADPDPSKIDAKGAGYELKNILGLSQLAPKVTIPFWEKVGELLTQGKITPLQYSEEKGLDAAKVNEVLDRYRDGKFVLQPHFRISK